MFAPLPLSRRKVVPDPQAGAGEISAIGWHSLARNETLVATGHADGRVLLLLVGSGPTGPPVQESYQVKRLVTALIGWQIPTRLSFTATVMVEVRVIAKVVITPIISRITRVLLRFLQRHVSCA